MKQSKHLVILPKEKAIPDFAWWFGCADEYLNYALLKTHDKAHTLFQLRLSFEFTLKAATVGLMNKLIKTRNPYKLFAQAALVVPYIKNIFPGDTSEEAWLFSLLVPRRKHERPVASVKLSARDLAILIQRIEALQTMVKAEFVTTYRDR